jgi:hypothetical protein
MWANPPTEVKILRASARTDDALDGWRAMYSCANQNKEPPMEQRTGFRAFVERHDALFTTAGALIVFLGFFMKEGVRETTKDLSDSIATANRFHSIHDALNSISQSELYLGDTLREIDHATSGNHSSDMFARDRSMIAMAPTFSAELDLERHKFLVTTELLDALPARPMNLERQRRELAQSLIDDPDATALKKEVHHYSGADTSEDAASKQRLEEEKSRIKHLMVHAVMVVMAISPKLDAFTRDVSDEAVRQKEEQEGKLKSATYIMYGLFTLGWGLGLIGKVLKLPALGGGE